MHSFEETRRQFRVALVAIFIILPVGVVGYKVLEHEQGFSWLDSIWLTITTLTTIGYGDKVALTSAGRVFTLALIVFGIGAYALAAQAAVQFFASPVMRETRMRRRAERKIEQLQNHYIICGEGKLVDRTINYLLKRAELRHANQRKALSAPIDRCLQSVLGKQQKGIRAIGCNLIRGLILPVLYWHRHGETLLDVIVVVTKDAEYARRLRENNILVIEDDPTDDKALLRAGMERAQAMMVMLESDTQTLLTVLTARSRNRDIFITATAHADLNLKINRVGANNVLAPFELAGQLLNNATLRPAVSMFFSSILFDQNADQQVVQLFLWDGSPWIGKKLADLKLRQRFQSGVFGLRQKDGHCLYLFDDHVLTIGEVLLTVTPASQIPRIQQDCYQGLNREGQVMHLEPLDVRHRFQTSDKRYSLYEAEGAVKELSSHFLICGEGPTIRSALGHLNPDRPFVFISNNNSLVQEMQQRGFRVVLGDPTQEETLLKAGVERALAIMISIDDDADQVLTILNCRTLSEKLLITSTANSDEMIPKLRRAGADRVISPFRIAAQFVLLATTRPAVSDFMQYVLFNYEAGIETTELYMEQASPWIGKTIAELKLKDEFNSGVVGVRQSGGQFLYAPQPSHVIGKNEVLIITTPMARSDELRGRAHGGVSKRPKTLRQEDMKGLRKTGVYKLSELRSDPQQPEKPSSD
jgi:Trk K+ transport system NAD-binding subunit